jgi:hypothetical protein
VLLAVDAHLGVHALGGAAQGQLTQGDEVALAEEVGQRLLRLAREIDLALAEALQERVGRQVDQLDLVACSNTESGTVSRMTTPVILATTSLRLSTCCTFTVV